LWLTLPQIEAQRSRLRSPLVWTCLTDHAAGKSLPLDAIAADASLHRPDIK
jgi:phosphatase NudJ